MKELLVTIGGICGATIVIWAIATTNRSDKRLDVQENEMKNMKSSLEDLNKRVNSLDTLIARIGDKLLDAQGHYLRGSAFSSDQRTSSYPTATSDEQDIRLPVQE